MNCRELGLGLSSDCVQPESKHAGLRQEGWVFHLIAFLSQMLDEYLGREGLVSNIWIESGPQRHLDNTLNKYSQQCGVQ